VIVAPPLGAVAPTSDDRALTSSSSGRSPPTVTIAGRVFGVSAATSARAAPTKHSAQTTATVTVTTGSFVHAYAHASSRVVVIQRSRTETQRQKPSAKPAPSKAPLPTAPRTPGDPFGPAAGSTSGAAGHGSGGSVLTVSLIAALGLTVFALLSGIVPAILPGRRRLNDDPRTRPG
jgi:hypothetical protein